MNNQAQPSWKNCLKYIKENISDHDYKTWFTSVNYVGFENSEVVLRLPNSFVYEILEERFCNLLHNAIMREFGRSAKLTYRFPADGTSPKNVNHSAGNMSSPSVTPTISSLSSVSSSTNHTEVTSMRTHDIDSNLNPSYTFENFIESESNKLTRTVGLSIAENPNQITFNPFFIYGASGVGKTHLVNAIGVHIKRKLPAKRVLYISAHLFKVQFSDASRNNKFIDFITFYQTIDVLIIDDIQEIAGNKGTQEAFFHIFNHLRQNGKQIIMTSDRMPASMEGFEERMLNRFTWGMVAEMEEPDGQLRKGVLLSRIRQDRLNFPPEVIAYISEHVTSSIRDLEGVINSLLAYSVVYNCEVSFELTERIVARTINLNKDPLSVDTILKKVCKHYGVSVDEVCSPSRKKYLTTTRQVAMYLSQKHTQLPYAQIGLRIGNRDHSTVIHSCRLIEKRIAADKDFRLELENIERALHKSK